MPSRTPRSSSRRSGTCSSRRSKTRSQLPFPTGATAPDDETPTVKDSMTKQYVKKAAEAIYKDLVRRKIAVDKRRPDGRGAEEIRTVTCEVGVSPAHRTVRRSSRGARPRSCRCSRSAPPRRASGSTTSHWRPSAATCTTTISRPTRSGRRASCAARAARHRPRRACPAGARADDPVAGGLPVHDSDRLRDAGVERLVVDGLGLRLDPCVPGRGRPDQGAGRRDRHGPGQGGRRLRDPDRHPGRRGPPGRHGLQGRRVAGRNHRAPDGHQDHRRHARDHEQCSRAGEEGARVHPRQDGRGAAGEPPPARRCTLRGSRRSRSTPSRSGS